MALLSTNWLHVYHDFKKLDAVGEVVTSNWGCPLELSFKMAFDPFQYASKPPLSPGDQLQVSDQHGVMQFVVDKIEVEHELATWPMMYVTAIQKMPPAKITKTGPDSWHVTPPAPENEEGVTCTWCDTYLDADGLCHTCDPSLDHEDLPEEWVCTLLLGLFAGLPAVSVTYPTQVEMVTWLNGFTPEARVRVDWKIGVRTLTWFGWAHRVADKIKVLI